LKALAVDLDGALGDTHALWHAFLADAARRYQSIARLDVGALPTDRAAAAVHLDRWATSGVGDWRAALERFAEDHAPVHVRPNGRSNAALRKLVAAGVRVGVYTDAPEELARVALAQLGAARYVAVVEGGAGAREDLLARLGDGAEVAETSAQLEAAATARG
jgi:phosphoglycolate phosphatase-like HAD superfamily hydrolase